MPAEYVRPIIVKYRPIPTVVASLIDDGIALASHCRIPNNVKPTNTNPSTKTAVSAIEYGTIPEP
jgi:hypothetical protein